MFRYLSPIDTHIHMRWKEYNDFNYNGMNFMALAFRDSMASGLSGILEMPNTTPQLTEEEIINERIILADKMNPSPETLYHGIYGGITNDLEQVGRIAILAQKSIESNGRIKGLKKYCAHSTGNMGVRDLETQKKVWARIASVGYNGNVSCHLEADDCYTGNFDYRNPISHSEKQNPESELVQAERQIRNARDSIFTGTFISAHTSNPATVDYLISERGNVPFEIAIEMNFHHTLLNTEDYKIHGNGVKVNPPIRDRKLQEGNLEHVVKGNVDIIGTDHAGHDPNKKFDPDNENPPSGIPELLAWPIGIAAFKKHGASEELIQKITFHNANRIFFDGKLKPRIVEVEYNPELWKAYGYNPFSRIEQGLGL